MGIVRLTPGDVAWLEYYFPSLWHDSTPNVIRGELSFCASFDKETEQFYIEHPGMDTSLCRTENYLCDAFEVEIHLDSASISKAGWPKVYEVGERKNAIISESNVSLADLHFFPDESCCLGIRYKPEKHLSIERLLYHLVIPFLYRLSYVDCYGLDAARRNLWGEYSHGNQGHKEYQQEMRNLAQKVAGKNSLCPCGSGIKYKRCCRKELKRWRR